MSISDNQEDDASKRIPHIQDGDFELPVDMSVTGGFPKVLLVGPSLCGGGAERRFSNIAKHLFLGGVDVAVLVRGQKTDPSLLTHAQDLGWRGRLSYIKVIWELRRRISQEKYDVLMSFGLFPNVVSIAAARFAGAYTKVIINEITRPKLESRSFGGWRQFVYNAIRCCAYRFCTLITANSKDGLQESCDLAGVPVESGVRVWNVVNDEQILARSLEVYNYSLPKGDYIICVGRLDFMKRIDTVIDAVGALRDRIGCFLVIVGDGKAQKALENQVMEMNLNDVVIFTGALENPFPLLSGASAFVLASEYEGYSNSLLEAMFCDVPVITSTCSSDAEEMARQGAVLSFEIGNVHKLSECIEAVLCDRALSQRLVACAREYRKPHALNESIRGYEKLICQVASTSTGQFGGGE